MTVALASFRAATLDRTARIVTRLVWGLGVTFVLVGIVLLGTSSALVGGVLIVIGVLDAGMAWWLRSREPVAFVRAEGRTVEAFVTDQRRVVVREVGERHVAVSPADVDGFVAACGRDDA